MMHFFRHLIVNGLGYPRLSSFQSLKASMGKVSALCVYSLRGFALSLPANVHACFMFMYLLRCDKFGPYAHIADSHVNYERRVIGLNAMLIRYSKLDVLCDKLI